jgi:hypothetical protein
MARKKQPKSKNGPEQTATAAGRFAIVLWTAVRTALNMTVVVVTSESVLLFLLAAKRFIVSAPRGRNAAVVINLIGSG